MKSHVVEFRGAELREARRAPLVVLVFVLGAACSSDVAIVTGSGSTGSGAESSSGSGSSSATGGAGARTIEIVDVSAGDDAGILVLHNRVDGTLVESWPASALPLSPTVVDGDLVTFAYPGDVGPVASSYRVERDVSRIEVSVVSPEPPPDCEASGQTMHVEVHVPSLPGALSAHVVGAPWEHADAFELPADLAIDVTSCDGGSTSDLFIHVDGPDGFVGFEYHVLMFVPGATVPLTPTFEVQPRKPLVLDVDGTDGANLGGGFGYWLRDYGGSGWITDEPGAGALDVAGDAPFVFEANLIDVPHGRPFASAWAYFPPPPAACDDSARIERYGPSDAPIPFHVSALARPTAEGASFALDPSGSPADVVLREWTKGAAQHGVWRLADDPGRPRPAVFPAFPSDSKLVFPEGDVALRRITHADVEGLVGYASWVAHAPPSPPLLSSTVRTRAVSYGCGL